MTAVAELQQENDWLREQLAERDARILSLQETWKEKGNLCHVC